MSGQPSVKVILGTHTLGDVLKDPGVVHFDSKQDVQKLLDTFYARGGRELDTAHDYAPSEPGASETRLGWTNSSDRFVIHTKVHSGPGEHQPANIAASIDRSLKCLKTDCVETMFLHVPDRTTPFEDTARAMNDAFKQGKFKRFGLSNYSAAEVQQIIDICESKGYIKPTVYQGHYNAIVRGGEAELFPLLRKHGIAFFAYSPAAGGLFSVKTDNTSARWSPDNMIGMIYSSNYNGKPITDAVKTVQGSCEKHGITPHAAAIRWTRFHSILDGSVGDAIIFGVSKMTQLEGTMDALDAGYLPGDLAEAIGKVYGTAKEAGVEVAYHL